MINRIKRSIAFRFRKYFLKPQLLPVRKITAEEVKSLKYNPLISVIVPVYNIERKYLTKCIESVLGQVYQNWELCLYDDCSTLQETLTTLKQYEGQDQRIKISYSDTNLNISNAMNKCAELSTGEFLSFLDNDDVMHKNALFCIAEALNQNRDIDYFYTDEDKIDTKGNHSELYLKPDYSPELLCTVMYFLHLITIRKTVFQKVGGFRHAYAGAQDYDLALRVTRETKKIHHIRENLYHWRKIPGSAADKVDAKPQALINAKKALEEHAAIISNGKAYVENGFLQGTFRLRYSISPESKVTILIPTNNGRRNLPGRGEVILVENLIKSILSKTDYKNYQIKVIDNGNTPDYLEDYYRRTNIELIHYQFDEAEGFNFAKKANFCFTKAESEYVLLLNDDMEIRDSGWLVALLEPMQNEGVGIVGAKLLYPDESIQHAGIVLHPVYRVVHKFHGLPKNAVGDYGFTHMIRNYSAVTGACLMTKKKILNDLNGFDLNLGIDFNDIDFCLRAWEKGYRTVYTPYCEIFHFEQSTLKRSDQKLAEKELFISRWKNLLERDPFSG